MPYTVEDGAILEVSIKGEYFTQKFLSLFHYELQMTGGPQDGAALINTINPLINGGAVGKLVGDYARCLHESAVLEEVVFQWVHPIRRPRVVKLPATLSGSVAGDQAPPNVAMAITKRSDVAGRLGIGTLHMPALSLGNVNGGFFTLDGQNLYGQLQTDLAAVITVAFGTDLIPKILHRAAPATSPTITSSENHRTVRTMHRRTVGVGE